MPIANKGTVRSLMQRTLALLRLHAPEVPAVTLPEQRVLDAYFGDGYGHATPAGRIATARAQELEGLKLDPTYTAKAFACLLAYVRGGQLSETSTVVFWHTGGLPGLFA